VQQNGDALPFASKEMKNKESVVLAAVQQKGCALEYASEDMKNKESIVLAAVQQNGDALPFASKEMRNKESVVLAAVQQNGFALGYASEEIKNEENVVLVAVQQNGDALRCASEEMKNKITQGASKFGIPVCAYARARRHPQLVLVQVSRVSASEDPLVTCSNMCGDCIATVTLMQEDDAEMLDQTIVKAVQPPYGAASLIVVLPNGQHLQYLVDNPASPVPVALLERKELLWAALGFKP